MTSIDYIDVADNVVLMRITGTGFNEGNVVCIHLDDRLVFIDAGRSFRPVKDFRSEMEKRFDLNTSFALLTHTHQDHYFGIDAFNDLPIITTEAGMKAVSDNIQGPWSNDGRLKSIEEVKGFFREKGEPLPERFLGWEKELLSTKLLIPTIGVKNEISIGSNEAKLRYLAVGGHSECSAFLYYEPDDILITGDNLVAEHAGNSACMLAGFDSAGLDILQRFEEYESAKMIPGHGPIVDSKYVKRSREWFTEMFGQLKKLKESDTPLEEAILDSDLPEFFEEKQPNQWEQILSFWYEKV